MKKELNLLEMLKFNTVNNIINDTVKQLKISPTVIVDPIMSQVNTWVENNIAIKNEINGHFDSLMSKCALVTLLKYLGAKYDVNDLIVDVDRTFAISKSSIEKLRKKASVFPEYVNKTLANGIFSVVLDEDMTRLVVIKSGTGNDRNSESPLMYHKIMLIFIGKNKHKWSEKITAEIDNRIMVITSSSPENSTLKYTVMSGNAKSNQDSAASIKVRQMQLLSFPQKDELLAKINVFLENKQKYIEFSVPHRLGILLAGKPGVGKTAFAFALAQYLDMDCVSVNLDYFDSHDGDGAFNRSQTIYVIDEIDSQIVNRAVTDINEVGKVQNVSKRLLQLLKAMDSMDGGSIVIATTNYPERLDVALLRSGRFDEIVNMDDIPYDYAVEMVENRGGDPKMILSGLTFPVNPALLEQMIIRDIMKTNNIGQKTVKSYEELGLENSDNSSDDDTQMLPDTKELAKGSIVVADDNDSAIDKTEVPELNDEEEIDYSNIVTITSDDDDFDEWFDDYKDRK